MKPSSKRFTITIGIMVGMFLAALETTVVGTAIPTVVSSLGGLEIYSWVFSAYLLTSTVTVPVWGKLSDLYGRRPFYIAAITLFLVGSVLCGQSQSMAQLIAFRAVQGLGAGGLLPLAMIIVADLYTPVERARVQGFFSAVWGVASIAGPLLGGIITDELSWRWVFYLNIPFGLVAGLIIVSQLVEEPSRFRKQKLDLSGIILFTTAVTFLMLMLLRGEHEYDLVSQTNLLFLVVAIVSMAFFIRAERKAAEPLIPVELFANKVFTAASINGFFAGMAMYGLISFIPLFVQGVLGTSATEAGSVLTPLLLGWVSFSAFGARMLLRTTFRKTMFFGMILMVLGFSLLSLMGVETTRIIVLRNVGLVGAGMGLVMITGLIAVQSSVRPEQLGIATSTSQFFRSVGGAIGVAIMGAAMSQRMNSEILSLMSSVGSPDDLSRLDPLVQNTNAFLNPATRGTFPPNLIDLFQSLLANGLHTTFVVGMVASVLALLSVTLMPSERLRRPLGKNR